MIAPADFVGWLEELGVTMYTGVPDSLLKDFGQHVMATVPRERHIIAANEGNAVAIALGHYLRSGQPALVYLQNSGIGNTVNPLLSLADPDVYGVPMVLLVGWRGQPGVHDEPQHVKQGRVMTSMLDGIDVPWSVLPTDVGAAATAVRTAVETAIERSGPYVILVEKGTFGKAASEVAPTDADAPGREETLRHLVALMRDDAVIVSTTGMLSRELFELRAAAGLDRALDFLTVGGMGHASSIALGVAVEERTREVWCFDGDGALLMHLGSLAVIADHAPPNYYHVVFNNGVHDSVGGQPTSIAVVDVPALARAAGYGWAERVASVASLAEQIAAMRAVGGPSLLEIRVRPGSRPDLGRPTRTPTASRVAFMEAFAEPGR